MGLIKLGSKLGSISAKHASGAFNIAEDLKQMRVTDGVEKGPKLQKQESASDKFYRKFAAEPSEPSEGQKEEKTYFVKQKSRGSGVLTNWVSTLKIAGGGDCVLAGALF